MSNFFTRVAQNAMAARATETTEENDILARYEKDKIFVDLKLSSKDYGWSNPDESVKVLLVNPATCADSSVFTTWNLMSMLHGTGHSEWEAIIADMLMLAVCEWYKNGAKADEPADISRLFNRDFLASGNRMFTKDMVSTHLNRIFNTEKIDADGTRYLKFKIA